MPTHPGCYILEYIYTWGLWGDVLIYFAAAGRDVRLDAGYIQISIETFFFYFGLMYR